MSQSIYYIEKRSQTFSDNLAAFGFAFILDALVDGRAQIRLEDVGCAFAIVCEPELQAEWVEQAEFQAFVPFLITLDSQSQKKVVKGTDLSPDDLPIGSAVVDYEVEKERRKHYFEWRKSLSREEFSLFKAGTLLPPISPHPDWDLFFAINTTSSLQTYNELINEWWCCRSGYGAVIQILLNMTAQLPNDLPGVEKDWEGLCTRQGWPVVKQVSAVQLLNPSEGKGTNASKAIYTSPNGRKRFWMLEYLKLVGFRTGGFTRLIKKPKDPKSKDRKTYSLVPHRLGWTIHNQIMGKFRQKMAGSAAAIQLDILASLRYTLALIEHFEAARAEDLEAIFLGHPATDLVQGMQMAFYKDMGNAIVTMNIASINLPQWVRPETPADFQALKEALAEHEVIIRMLDETRGDQYELLKHYRDFLSANDLIPFFRFATAYSGFIIHQLERRQPVRPFTTTTLEVLFMNSNDQRNTYSQIVQSPGFRNIAKAIRHSTVIPQYQKRPGSPHRPTVDVRYGLGQQLARKSAYSHEFLAELSEFITAYNAENARLVEKGRKPYRGDVTTQDIEAIIELVDCFGSKVVCNMLVAYGYAREPYQKGIENGANAAEPDDTAQIDNENIDEE